MQLGYSWLEGESILGGPQTVCWLNHLLTVQHFWSWGQTILTFGILGLGDSPVLFPANMHLASGSNSWLRLTLDHLFPPLTAGNTQDTHHRYGSPIRTHSVCTYTRLWPVTAHSCAHSLAARWIRPHQTISSAVSLGTQAKPDPAKAALDSAYVHAHICCLPII